MIKEVYGRSTTKKHIFHFDEVFTNFSTQEEVANEAKLSNRKMQTVAALPPTCCVKVFSTTLEPMIDDVMSGFEATVFAYGQTGKGSIR